MAVVVGASFLCAGLVAWRVRPRSRVGPLMVVTGLLWAIAKLSLPAPGAVLTVVGGAWAAVLAHLVVAFPTGRLVALAPRLVVGLAYLSAVATGSLAVLAPGNAVHNVGTPAAIVIGVAVIGLQFFRWRSSSATRRRLLGPVSGTAAVATALFVVLKPVTAAGLTVPYLAVLTEVALTTIPLAYLAGLLRRRIDRAGVAELVVRLGGAAEPTSIQRALANALHDPTLQVGYRVPESDRYVDINGESLLVPDGADRAITRVDSDGHPLALLVHDPALLDDPELINAACAAAALALENERLTADLRARLRQLAESRSQLLRAAEAERRRLERDLHDGVQQRLLSIPMTLSMAESALRDSPDRARPLISEAKDTTLAVLAALRALSQGIHPPILTERGLPGAVREIAALAPMPVRLVLDLPAGLPADVETTAYYVVAEAIANATKHANARQAEVRIAHYDGRMRIEIEDDGCGGANPAAGSGLRGLANRVASYGGVLCVDSPPGQGTRIEVMLPCA